MTDAFKIGTGTYKDLKDSWKKLEDLYSNTYFQSSSWQEVWFELIEPKAIALNFLTISEHDQAKLGSSFTISERRIFGLFKIRTAFLNGTGKQVFDVICQENCQPIVSDLNNFDLLKHFLRYLLVELNVDRIVINSVPANFLLALNKCCAELSVNILTEKKSPNYFIDLEQIKNSGQTYASILNHRARSSIKRSSKEYLQTHGELKISYANSAKQTQEWLVELAELNISRLKEKEIHSSFNAPFLLEFHNALIEKAFVKQEIFCAKIEAGDYLIGIVYGFAYKGTVSIYQTGFVFEENNKLSPGLVAHQLIIEELLKGKIKKYDFLAGDYQYKRTLSNRSDELIWINILKPRFLLQLEQKLKVIKRKLFK